MFDFDFGKRIRVGPNPKREVRGHSSLFNKNNQLIPAEKLEISFTDSTISWAGTLIELQFEGNGFFELLHYEIHTGSKEKVLAGAG